MKKKKSMQRESGNLSTNFHHPKKTVNVNIVVEGDNQSNENSLSQKQDIRYQQPIQQPKEMTGNLDEGLKEQLARSIQKLDLANDLATQKNIVLPSTLQDIPKSILDVKNSDDIRNLIKHIENMVLEINKLIASAQPVQQTVQQPFQQSQPTQQTFTPTFNNTPNPFRYAQQAPPYTPYVPPPSYVAPKGTGPPPTYEQAKNIPAGATPVDTKTSTSNIPQNPTGGGRRIFQDYERMGDSLRDQTIVDVQSSIQRGDLPVLQNAYAELIQAEKTLNQYIALEPRADVDQQIRAQIMDLDQYKNQLEAAITAARQPPQVFPITDEPEPQTEAPETPSPATPAPAQPPPTTPPTPTTPKNLEADFEAFKGRYNKEITGNKDTVLMLRSVLFDIIQRARVEQNDTILNQAVSYDENIVDRLMILEKQQSPPAVQPEYKNEFAPYLTNEKKKLQDYLMSKPQTNRPRAVQADSVITNRINQKISLLDLAINKPDLTDDEFDVAMTLIPIDIIQSWPVLRALVILKGESVKPNRLSKVELQQVQTPAGVPQLYKLYFDNTELTGADNTETFFKSTGELYESSDLTPTQPTQPQTPQTSLIQQKLDMLYTTGNPNTNTVANVLKTQIEAGGDTIIDRAGNNLPTAYAAIVSGFNDQRIIKNIVFQPADMVSFGGNSDQAYILIVDGVQFKPMGMTRYFNRFGEDYTGIDYEGGYNPTLTYPFRKN